MKLSYSLARLVSFSLVLVFFHSAQAAPPSMLSHQGRVVSEGLPFTGAGQFKFALVNTAGSTSYWSQDGTSVAGSQTKGVVVLSISNGFYSVRLGDPSVPGMTSPISASIFANSSDVRLRVWFDDGVHGLQQLSPDQPIASVGYSLVAERLTGFIGNDNLLPGSITASKLDSEVGWWKRTDFGSLVTSQYVGIGTESPLSPLHVTSNNGGGDWLVLGNNPNQGGNTALTFGRSADKGGDCAIQSISSSGTNYGNLWLNPDGGFVGVGSRNPRATLHVGIDGGVLPTMMLGGDPRHAGSTLLAFSITSEEGGQSVIQSIKESGVQYGDLLLNRDGGKVGIGTSTPSTALDVAGEVTMTACNITSDRNAKDGFAPISPREVLQKVNSLNITEWQYKTQPGVRHIGPMAQDFKAAFELGRDERHITTVDADGVALAAIQGLTQLLAERDAELKQMKRTHDLLAERLGQLESRMGVDPAQIATSAQRVGK